MIYLPNLDIHLSPDSLYYGLSDIEPVVHISETNRIMDEEDFKEIARSAWAANGIIQIDTQDSAQSDGAVSNFIPDPLRLCDYAVDRHLDALRYILPYVTFLNALNYRSLL
jgi:hypothetical protein